MKKLILALAIYLPTFGLTFVGCSLFGNKASDPGKVEQALFNSSNTPMVTVHDFTNYVNVTNVVQKIVPQIVTITVTNEVGVVVPVFKTNYIEVEVTNVTKKADTVIPAGTTVQVPQLSGPSPAVETGIGLFNSIPGWGTIAAAVVGIGFGAYQKLRNRSLAAKHTLATEDPATILANLKVVAAQKSMDADALESARAIMLAPKPPTLTP